LAWLAIIQADEDSSSQQKPTFVGDAEESVALLRRQFDVSVDPEGRLIHARRKSTTTTTTSSESAMFAHCPPSAVLGAWHSRVERLLEVRARLELMRMVAEQVRTGLIKRWLFTPTT